MEGTRTRASRVVAGGSYIPNSDPALLLPEEPEDDSGSAPAEEEGLSAEPVEGRASAAGATGAEVVVFGAGATAAGSASPLSTPNSLTV